MNNAVENSNLDRFRQNRSIVRIQIGLELRFPFELPEKVSYLGPAFDILSLYDSAFFLVFRSLLVLINSLPNLMRSVIMLFV